VPGQVVANKGQRVIVAAKQFEPVTLVDLASQQVGLEVLPSDALMTSTAEGVANTKVSLRVALHARESGTHLLPLLQVVFLDDKLKATGRSYQRVATRDIKVRAVSGLFAAATLVGSSHMCAGGGEPHDRRLQELPNLALCCFRVGHLASYLPHQPPQPWEKGLLRRGDRIIYPTRMVRGFYSFFGLCRLSR
jgi:hypothetical protein